MVNRVINCNDVMMFNVFLTSYNVVIITHESLMGYLSLMATRSRRSGGQCPY